MDAKGNGRLVVITGASQGIGAATALAFARKEACRIVLIARNVEKLNDVAAQCAATDAATHVFGCDVTDTNAVQNVTGEILDKLGAPDVVVNNAGSFAPSSIADMSPDIWQSQIDSNLTSSFLVTRAFLNSMIARRSGTFVFMGSVASIKGYPGGAAYCAAKHGVLGLARSLRAECIEHGIRVITFLPGAT
ncbi:MAG: SDR family oxidoreductase, partial [Rhodothermales bacterium]|nr:SDR family oxidoreductase [Rhodothermales bacterium]